MVEPALDGTPLAMSNARMTKPLSLRLTREIGYLKQEFAGYSEAYAVIAVRRAHLAPAFLATFKRWQRETGRSFVAFVHELDPSVPAARDEYTMHRSYQAALYLKRIAEAPHTTPAYRTTVTPFQLLARLLKSLRPLLAPGRDVDVLNAVVAASHWRPRDVERLRTAVAKAKLIPMPGAPRLVSRHAAGHQAELAIAADRGRQPVA